jgi:hypothetical protein
MPMNVKTPPRVLGWFLAAGVSAALAGPTLASDEVRPVSMTLQGVTVTDGWQVVTFVLTNAGTIPVQLASCAWSALPTNVTMPLGLCGHCTVPPQTNGTMTFRMKNYSPGPHWWRYAVFTPASTILKTEVAAARLGKRVSGKSHDNRFWLSDLWSPAYEVTSPIVQQLPRIPPPPDNWVKPAF